MLKNLFSVITYPTANPGGNATFNVLHGTV